MFDGQTVALVGNGPASRAYDAVDACDAVIRCNLYRLGHDTGWVTTHHAMNAAELARETPAGVKRIACVPSDRLRHVPGDCQHVDVWLPRDWLRRLDERMTARPSVGCMLTHWLLECCNPARVVMVGFSWCNHSVAKVHDLEEERRMFDAADTRKVVLL
jgi:hypothetical protein